MPLAHCNTHFQAGATFISVQCENAIGLQELGQFQKKFNKQKKLEILHIAICKLLSDYGYYQLEFIDQEGWPHYKLNENLPNLKPGEQTILIKKAIIKIPGKLNI